MAFIDYLREKTLNTNKICSFKDPKDRMCINVGYKIANRFGLKLNGWQEITFMFTIPDNVPDARNTFTAKNEEELVNKLKQRFPGYFDYIMKKNFPDGYQPDITIPDNPPQECEPMDLSSFAKSLKKEV